MFQKYMAMNYYKNQLKAGNYKIKEYLELKKCHPCIYANGT